MHEQGERKRVEIMGVKVFSSTKAKDRDVLGDKVTGWIRENPDVHVIDKTVTQSSDREFHCLTITLFYRSTALGIER